MDIKILHSRTDLFVYDKKKIKPNEVGINELDMLTQVENKN